jgi:uncharacterized membrane protein YphA (DoxX/SURF4 family)
MTYYGIIALCFGLTLILVTVSSLMWRRPNPARETVNLPARVFLVLLRIAIGWHCCVEGLEKLHNPTWTAEPYLREAYGPAAPAYRWLVGDRLLDRLVMTDNEQPPPGLTLDYDTYTDAFVAHYGLDDEQVQKARDTLRQAKSKAVTWLTSQTETVTKIAADPPPLKLDWTIRERLEEYNRLQEKATEAERQLPSYDKATQKRFVDAKANLNKWRADLKKSYDAQFATFKKALQALLMAEQKNDYLPMPDVVALPMAQWGPLEWSDRAVAWGLVIIGSGLMLGLFSRLCSFGGAVLVLSFFLAMPPLPGWPESPRLEGHYLFINKTLIEVLALSALTFLPTGRWAGVDALLYRLWPWNWERPTPAARSRVPAGEPDMVEVTG